MTVGVLLLADMAGLPGRAAAARSALLLLLAWIDPWCAILPLSGIAALPFRTGTEFRPLGTVALLRMNLKEIRKMLGLTQTDVAKIAKMNQSDLSRAEKRNDHLVSTLRRYVKSPGRRPRDRRAIREQGDPPALSRPVRLRSS